ncbi:hypothetical protein OAS39_06245, partial [Pirellulales bacterium]|nr:hypothetical protein [Pirellulales bacterium]
MLNSDQKQKILQVVRFGCDRLTACDYVDCTPSELADAMTRDAEFQSEYRRAAATAEVNRMKVINEAADDVKNWRAATWWFERREQERAEQGGVDASQLQPMVEQIESLIVECIDHLPTRRRLLTRLG